MCIYIYIYIPALCKGRDSIGVSQNRHDIGNLVNLNLNNTEEVISPRTQCALSVEGSGKES